MKPRTILAAIILAFALATSGCSSPQTGEQAARMRSLGEVSANASDNITAILERYPPGTIEDGLLADLIVAVLPERWKEPFESFVADQSDQVRQAATDISEALRVTATESFNQASILEAKAGEESTGIDNALTVANSVLHVFTQPDGAIMVGLGVLAGLFKHRERAERARADQNHTIAKRSSEASVQMRDVAENLVNSIEVWKSTPSGAQSWANGARKPIIASQTEQTASFVQAVKARQKITANASPKAKMERAAEPPIEAPVTEGTPAAPGPDQY